MQDKDTRSASPADWKFVRPNWQDETQYAWVEEASASAIAWEFLRRNSDYEAQYAEHHADLWAYEVDGESSVFVAHWVDGDGEQVWENKVSDARVYELFAKYPGIVTTEALTTFLGAKWGLQDMVAPCRAYGGFAVRFRREAGSYGGPATQFFPPGTFVKVEGTKGTPFLDLRIDLSLPLEVLALTLKTAIREQRQLAIKRGDVVAINNRKGRNALYAEYLRILDGLHAGLSAPAIGAIIEPKRANDSRIRERDKRFNAAGIEALRLMRDGYKVLPLLEVSASNKARKK